MSLPDLPAVPTFRVLERRRPPRAAYPYVVKPISPEQRACLEEWLRRITRAAPRGSFQILPGSLPGVEVVEIELEVDEGPE